MYTMEISVPIGEEVTPFEIDLPSMMDLYFKDLNVVESGSGCGLGFRDMDFTFYTYIEAFEALMRIHDVSQADWVINVNHQMWLP